MSRSRILLAIFVGLPVTVLLTLNASVAESVSDECRARPGSSAAPGTYWRYRVSRPGHRRCWFLSFEPVKIRSHNTRSSIGFGNFKCDVGARQFSGSSRDKSIATGIRTNGFSAGSSRGGGTSRNGTCWPVSRSISR